jgi:hypothetical protein
MSGVTPLRLTDGVRSFTVHCIAFRPKDPSVQGWGHSVNEIYGEKLWVKPMGEMLEFPKPISSNGNMTRNFGRSEDNFRWNWCEPITVDLRTVNADTAPCEYVTPPDDCA